MNDSHSHNANSSCQYDRGLQYLDARFYLVVVVQTFVCAFGMLGNILTILVLTRGRMRSTSGYFLVMLAVADTLVMVATVLLYCAEVLYDFMLSFFLYYTWFSYVKFVYVFSHITQVSTVYLTVAATIERFISLWFPAHSRRICSRHLACVWIAMLLVCVVCVTITKYWEIDVLTNVNCTGFGMFSLAPSSLLRNPMYELVYSVWVSNILFIWAPFLALSILNSMIFYKMRHSRAFQSSPVHSRLTTRSRHSGDTDAKRSIRKERKQRNREATVVLLVVVLVFLFCNFPSFMLTLAEHIAHNTLITNRALYIFSRDVINLLTVINSSANFVIYVIFGSEFRRELARLCCRGSSSRDLDNALAAGETNSDVELYGEEELSNSSMSRSSSLTLNNNVINLSAMGHYSDRNGQTTTKPPAGTTTDQEGLLLLNDDVVNEHKQPRSPVTYMLSRSGVTV